MKLLFSMLEDATSAIIILLILVAFFSIIPFLIGLVSYWLLSIAFPEYISFGWYWFRFIALGFIGVLLF